MKMPNYNKLDTMFNSLFHNCLLSYKKSILWDIKNKTKQNFSHFSHRNMGCQMNSPIASIISGCTALFGKSMYDNFLPLPTPCFLEHTSLDCHNPIIRCFLCMSPDVPLSRDLSMLELLRGLSLIMSFTFDISSISRDSIVSLLNTYADYCYSFDLQGNTSNGLLNISI